MPATRPGKRVVVVGGGITGLTTCYRLCQAAQEHGLPLQVTLLEGSERLGGIIATSHQQGLLLEQGPDCFITSKPGGVQLCDALGLSAQLMGTTTSYRQSFIVRHGTLRPVPQGLHLLVPGSWWSFATSSILSWPGKLRLALDLLVPRRTSTDDESLAHFVTRRLGREALERLAQPMVSGIYTADPAQLSMQATVMRPFAEMEQRHGSLLRAIWRQQRAAQHPTQTAGTSGPRYGLFVTLQAGMQTLVDCLAQQLPAGTVHLQESVQGIERLPTGWRLHVQDRPPYEADGLCLALPAPQAGHLLKPVDPTLADALHIPYASSAIVNVAYRRTDVAHPLNGMGFVVPAVEKRGLIACSFSSVKFTSRAPVSQVLLRAFVGGALQQDQYARTDEEIQHTVCQELRQLLSITSDPIWIDMRRHPQSMPQYHVGHVQRVARIASMVQRWPGLSLAGNAYHGVGIPDCIDSGSHAAQALLSSLFPMATPLSRTDVQAERIEH